MSFTRHELPKLVELRQYVLIGLQTSKAPLLPPITSGHHFPLYESTEIVLLDVVYCFGVDLSDPRVGVSIHYFVRRPLCTTRCITSLTYLQCYWYSIGLRAYDQLLEIEGSSSVRDRLQRGDQEEQ